MPCEQTNWKVVYLMGVVSLIQNTQYSIYITTMFAYLKKLNNSATERQYGWIMAISSLGQCIGCYALGYWNSRSGKIAPSLFCGFLLMLASNLVYLLVDNVNVVWVAHIIMLSRLFGGLGMGNSNPMRTCAALQSTPSDRSKAMASISGGRAVGAVVGPGLQLAFLTLGENGITLIPGVLSLHSNNAAAFLGLLLTLIGMMSLMVLFEEREPEKEDKEKVEYPDPDKLAMFICMLTRFVQNFLDISIETIATAYLMMMYFQTRQVGSSRQYGHHLPDYRIYCNYPLSFDHLYQTLYLYSRQNLQLWSALATYSWQFYNRSVMEKGYSNVTLSGCDDKLFEWCQGLTVPPEIVFYAGYVISFGVFLPFINVANATLYSKLLNPDCQGIQQSLFDASNTMARVVAPIIITIIYTAFGPRRVWEFLCFLLLVTSSLWIVFDKRMVPMKPLNNILQNDGLE